MSGLILKHYINIAMATKKVLITLASLLVGLSANATKLPKSLVPSTPSKAVDYFCTWNVQGYANNCNTSQTRFAMNEQSVFGKGRYENWISFYPEIRSDLIFVMDDSWDVPLDMAVDNGSPHLGTVQLNTERFPSYTGDPTVRLKKLVRQVKRMGWKGLGGWVAAQAPKGVTPENERAYWTERLKESQNAGFTYWKVDWGHNSGNAEWREMLTKLSKTNAPDVVLEHAMNDQFVEFSDVYRTYDVENIIAQPSTIQRVANVLQYSSQSSVMGLINCEDEPYIAAGLGCTIGVMRHPFLGSFADGTPDFAFPAVGRNVKCRVDEVIRGVRWHRIAEPFAVGGEYEVDNTLIGDRWLLGANETWRQGAPGRKVGDTVVEMAPSRVSRGLPLATIKGEKTGKEPFLLSSRYPSGAVAIATIGRAFLRQYICTPVDVEQQLKDMYTPIGIFGVYNSLTLIFADAIPKSGLTILAQDLASDRAVDITQEVSIDGNKLILSGELINKIGLMKSTDGDLSDAGMVMQIFAK